MPKKKMYVAGSIVIPIYFPVSFSDKIESVQYVNRLLSSSTISVIHADIHTWEGASYPLIVRRCNVEWFDVVSKEEVF